MFLKDNKLVSVFFKDLSLDELNSNIFLDDCGFITVLTFSLIALLFICIKLNSVIKIYFTLGSLNYKLKNTNLIINRAFILEAPKP